MDTAWQRRRQGPREEGSRPKPAGTGRSGDGDQGRSRGWTAGSRRQSGPEGGTQPPGPGTPRCCGGGKPGPVPPALLQAEEWGLLVLGAQGSGGPRRTPADLGGAARVHPLMERARRGGKDRVGGDLGLAKALGGEERWVRAQGEGPARPGQNPLTRGRGEAQVCPGAGGVRGEGESGGGTCAGTRVMQIPPSSLQSRRAMGQSRGLRRRLMSVSMRVRACVHVCTCLGAWVSECAHMCTYVRACMRGARVGRAWGSPRPAPFLSRPTSQSASHRDLLISSKSFTPMRAHRSSSLTLNSISVSEGIKNRLWKRCAPPG